MKKGSCFKIYGRVQGVGFRFYTKKKANELGLSGYVKNMRDGSVYVEAEGSEEKMDEFSLWIQHGPEWARVDDVQVQTKPLQDVEGFTIN